MPSDDNLPEKLPEAWLNQLKDALKQDTRKLLFLTLLGSSVVAAIVTAGANYVLEVKKLNNAAQVEKYKICLDLRREDLKESRAAYSTIAEKFRQFEADFSDCLATCQEALPDKNHQTPRDAYEALITVVNDLVVLQSSAVDTRASAEVRSSLSEIIIPAIEKIHSTVDNVRKRARITELDEFVEWANAETPKIQLTKRQIETAGKTLKLESCDSNDR